MFHKSSTIQRHIGRLPYLLAQGECYSGAERQLVFYFVFFCRSLEDASCPQNVEEGWAYYSEHDSGWRVKNVKVVLV